MKDCPCEKRYKNNATRLAAISTTVTNQLKTYFQQLYKTNINYPVKVSVEGGNKTYTLFSYTVKVPQTEQSKAKKALIQTCKDDKVFNKFLIIYFYFIFYCKIYFRLNKLLKMNQLNEMEMMIVIVVKKMMM